MTPALRSSAASYSLEKPDADYLIAALLRASGPERAMKQWSLACDEAEVERSVTSPNAAELARIVDAISRQGGVAGVAAVAMKIRMSTYAAKSSARSS